MWKRREPKAGPTEAVTLAVPLIAGLSAEVTVFTDGQKR